MPILTTEEQKDLEYQISELSDVLYKMAQTYAALQRNEVFAAYRGEAKTENGQKIRNEKAQEVWHNRFNEVKADGYDRFIKVKSYIDKLLKP